MTTTDTSASSAASSSYLKVWRVEVYPDNAAGDPLGASIRHEAHESGLAPTLTAVRTAHVYLLQGAFDAATVERIAGELLTDPVTQRYVVAATPSPDDAVLVEVHYLPGVMDPVAQSTRDAILDMLGRDLDCQVRTGMRYELVGVDLDQANTVAQRLLANPVIQEIHFQPLLPEWFAQGYPYQLKRIEVRIRDLDDVGLTRLSRDGHLFLSLAEMEAIQAHFRQLGREPSDIELETLAQTWSEHCVHKTLKSSIRYRETSPEGETQPIQPSASDWQSRPGHEIDEEGHLVIDNLLRSTIAAATNELCDRGVDWCISVFEDNAGVIEFDEADGVSFKVETHNHPSAIEPYGGAATGVGGCIRDTIGTGLAAKPIANTDVFCVADPNWPLDQLPRGVLHPRRILKQVVAGVRDYGNRMGIPTVNGAVWFDDRYLGNPLVYCGSVGLIPRDKCFGAAQPGDRIIVLGGRTGRDGIHGATFSSSELTDTHADEFSHAVQIGNAITEKKTLDVILQARDHEQGPLFSAITDCGAGGYSSAVGEMGERIGACVDLDRAPLKYQGLSYTEIWISEAQERMVLAVPPDKLETLRELCDAEDVELCDLGQFGWHANGPDEGEPVIVLQYAGEEVGRISAHFLHEGLPQPTREARWSPRTASTGSRSGGRLDERDIDGLLHGLLGDPCLASKHWIIRQYDHEVQGSSVVKPLVGAHDDGPSDAAVLRPKLQSHRGVALSCGLAPSLGDVDPYWMALAAIDEAVRNAICVGARADRIAILDNFCWANCDKPDNLGALVRAAEACYDGAMAFGTPFISGKDSLNNEFRTEDGQVIAIPPTLLISAMGIVDDVRRCVTMDAKQPGNLLVQVGLTDPGLAAARVLRLLKDSPVGSQRIARVDLARAPKQLATVAKLISDGLVLSAHDASEGGLLVATAEMAFAGRLGVALDLAGVPRESELNDLAACFGETPSRILLEVEPARWDDVARALQQAEVPFGQVGRFDESDRLTVRCDEHGRLADISIESLRQAWLKPLNW